MVTEISLLNTEGKTKETEKEIKKYRCRLTNSTMLWY
jgi:hypothetical protein